MSARDATATTPTGGVDCHVHLAPELTRWPEEGGKLVIDGQSIGPPALRRPRALLEHLDALGLGAAVVSPPPPFFRQELSADDAASWSRTLNDGILAQTAVDARLLPLAYLPLEHPGVARAELARCAGDPRWAGYCASAGGGSPSLADERLASLWAALDAAGSMLLLHPGASPDARLAEFYLHNLLGNPVETAVAAAQLVFGAVLSRYERMRVLLVHCGGCVPDLVPRWDHGVATRRPGVPALPELPSAAVRRFYVDCLVHDPGAVDRAVTVFGADRVVLGSDWPFPMGTSDPRALVAHRGEVFTEDAASTNAARLLGLP